MLASLQLLVGETLLIAKPQRPYWGSWWCHLAVYLEFWEPVGYSLPHRFVSSSPKD